MVAYTSDITGETYCEKHAPNDGYIIEKLEEDDCCAICEIRLLDPK